jgi:molecular chaperone DnaK (HSP70)
MNNNFEIFKMVYPSEAQWLEDTAPRWDMAASLLNAAKRYGDLTERQLAVITNGIERDARRAEKKAQAEIDRIENRLNAPAVDTAGVDRLKAAFDHAIANAAERGRGLKRPKITIDTVVISPAPAHGKNPGAIYVKDDGLYLGKIAGGQFFASRDCTEAAKAKVLSFIADPMAAAEAYGLETGRCCICNRELTNADSVGRGIGPICRERMGW